MRAFSILTTLVSTLSTASTRSTGLIPKSAASSPLEVFESVYETPQGWTRHERPDPSTRLRLRVALEIPDHALFEETLYSISTPDHPSYGNHLSHDEVKRLVRPRDSSIEGVLYWLKSSGVDESDIINNGEWIIFKAAVTIAEKMMGTTFHYYTQDADKIGVKKIRTLQYSVPSDLAPHIAMIEPTTRFGQIKPQHNAPFEVVRLEEAPASLKAAAAPASPGAPLNVTACNVTITPDCLRALYNIGDYYASPIKGSLFGIAGYLNEYAKYAPLDAFLKKYAPYAVSQSFKYKLINGGKSTQNSTADDVEANLDMQYAASLGYKDKIKYYSTGGLGYLIPDLDQPDPADNQNEPYLEFVNYLSNLPDDQLPQTLTTSYGEDEQSVPEKYSKTVCNIFGKLGLRGVSILFSSGDTGVGSACQTNDGKNTTRFLPIFPAACPYVTSVGGTRNVEPEQAVYFSSGGFSDRWETPKYQDGAVKDYLKVLGKQWKGLYNPKGRGFPDVAAQGYRYHVVEQNYTTGAFYDILVGGTSASSPTFAAIVSLLNNARLKDHKKPLGFLNPWLYSVGKAGLNDITKGGSTGCTGTDIYSGLPTPIVPYASWNATKGWDPVTGLGTPNFKKLLAISSGKYY